MNHDLSKLHAHLDYCTIIELHDAKVHECVSSVASFMSVILVYAPVLDARIIERLYDQWYALAQLELPIEDIAGIERFTELTSRILQLPIDRGNIEPIKTVLSKLSYYRVGDDIKCHFRKLLPGDLAPYLL